MGRQCSFIKPSGERCRGTATGPQGLCWAHDPANAEQRRRTASRAGKSKPNKEIVSIRGRLSDLADDVLEGRVDRADAAVAGQLLGTVIRAIGTELKVREQQELEGRMEELEGLLESLQRQEGPRRWGG